MSAARVVVGELGVRLVPVFKNRPILELIIHVFHCLATGRLQLGVVLGGRALQVGVALVDGQVAVRGSFDAADLRVALARVSFQGLFILDTFVNLVAGNACALKLVVQTPLASLENRLRLGIFEGEANGLLTGILCLLPRLLVKVRP